MGNQKYFGEEDFLEKMDSEVKPWLSEHEEEGTITGEGGLSLHWYAVPHPEEKAAVVLVHGFCEFFGKYHEMAYYLWNAGYSVYFLEQRGHGQSDRENENPDAVYVSDFLDYVRDEKTFVDQVVLPRSTSKKLYLLAHSMGGLVGTLMLEEYPELFKKAVLSSPMLEINYGSIPPFVVKILAVWGRIAHWQKRYVPGGHDFDGKSNFETSSQRSPSRYKYMFDQRLSDEKKHMNGATYGWTIASMKAVKRCRKNVNRIDQDLPVLLLSAGNDTKVDVRGHEEFLKKRPQTKALRFPESKHEIFNSVTEDRNRFYDAILDFYEEG